MNDDKWIYSSKEITKYIKKCDNFSELCDILYSEYSGSLNHIHLSAIIYQWAFLWKEAHKGLRSSSSRKKCQQEIKLMSEHLKGKSFSWLIDHIYGVFENLGAIGFSSISNAISHFPLSPQGSQLMVDMAVKINLSSLKEYRPWELSNLANAMAKIIPKDKASITLMKKFILHVNQMPHLQNFKPQELSLLANAMAKIVPEDEISITLMKKIIHHLNRMPHLQNFKPQELSLLANATAKIVPEDEASIILMKTITHHVNQMPDLKKFESQHLSLLANATAKIVPKDKASIILMKKITHHVNQMPDLQNFKPQGLSLLANAMTKIIPEDKTCITLMKKLTHHVNQMPDLQEFKPQGISTLAHSMAKIGIINLELFLKLDQHLRILNLSHCSVENLSQIYQFYLYSKSKGLEIKLDPSYMKTCHQLFAKKSTIKKPSRLQTYVTQIIKDLFSNDPSYHLTPEYPTAGCRIDLALFQKNNNGTWREVAAIQVDGPAHYKHNTQEINRHTSFNSELLITEGWPAVIRMPYYTLNEYEKDIQTVKELFKTYQLVPLDKPILTPSRSNQFRFQYGPPKMILSSSSLNQNEKNVFVQEFYQKY